MSSNTDTEISFLVYAAKGTKLYKNNEKDAYFSFSVDNGFVRVSLKSNDSMRVRSDNNATHSVDISLENSNNFAIDVEITKEKDEVTYGSHIKAKHKKKITVTKSDKLSVLKEEVKTNESDAESKQPPDSDLESRELPEESDSESGSIPEENPRDKRHTDDKKTNESDIAPELPKTKSEVIELEIYADKGSKLDINFVITEVDGKPLYKISPYEFKNDSPLKILSKSDDDYFMINSGGNVTLKNKNTFPIAVKIKNDTQLEVIHFKGLDKKPLKLVNKVSQVFVTEIEEKQLSESSTQSEKFPLIFYGESGVKLYKNGVNYFTFSKKGLSGVDVMLRDNDYIDIGPDLDFTEDPELHRPTQYTIEKPEVRRKKRRLRVRNNNHFFVILRAEKDLKTYIIPSFSESFIFFGKETCKLYLLKGRLALTNRLPASQADEIIIYIAFDPLPPEGFKIKVRGNNNEADYSRPVQIRLKNNETLAFSITGLKSYLMTLIVASDPSNRNIMIRSDKPIEGDSPVINVFNAGYVIKPGGVAFMNIGLNKENSSAVMRVTNRLIKKIQIHETTDFRIPFKIIPYIRMSTSMEVDLLNTSIYELQDELQKERKRKGPTGDCDVLTKMLYSTFVPFNAKNKPAAWAFAILFSNEKGLDKVLITMMALKQKFKELGKYIIVEKLLTEFLSTVKSSDYYKSRVTDLMKKDFATFLFELNISENGFIVCMYRPARKASLWDEPWRWFSELPTKIDAGI